MLNSEKSIRSIKLSIWIQNYSKSIWILIFFRIQNSESRIEVIKTAPFTRITVNNGHSPKGKRASEKEKKKPNRNLYLASITFAFRVNFSHLYNVTSSKLVWLEHGCASLRCVYSRTFFWCVFKQKRALKTFKRSLTLVTKDECSSA